MVGVRILPGRPGRRPFRRALAAAGALAVLALSFTAAPARAQDAGIIRPGATAVTGFSGTVLPGVEEGIPPGVDPVDETFIDTGAAALRIFDLSSLGGPAVGQTVTPPPPFEATAGQIGQVFSLTYDDGVRDGGESGVPNLYAGATSLYGIRIVAPDADGDGRPQRLRRGAAGAAFMEGQFGVENGGGPGTVWKIDGLTGAVSRFADIASDSGPGIADIAFDRDHREFFASDLDSGLIHRIDAGGNLLDTFDHGLEARPRRGLEPVADDGAAMDIKGSAFDAEDPATWGFTQDDRRVWALAYRDGRLYYSVGGKAQIWSVGIAAGGGFADDARRELTVRADKDYAVTDIAFDDGGRMYLAQRGPLESRYGYGRFARSGKAEVLRYARETPDDPATESAWVEAPEEYAVGFPDGHRQSAGGIDLQYGYDGKGAFGGACAGTLVTTGDDLRDDPALAGRLAVGGPAAVHGVQLTPVDPVRPKDEPPFGSWFVDYDGRFDDPSAQGHVGDVEVWRPCQRGQAAEAKMLEDYPAFASDDILILLELPPCAEGRNPRERKCRDRRRPDLKVEKRAAAKRCTQAGGCDFVITVTNEGDGPFHGGIVLDEVTLPAGSVLVSGPNPPWTCAPAASPLACTLPATTLAPGQSVELKLGFKPPAGFEGRTFRNCVLFDRRRNDREAFGYTHRDRACASIPICRRGDNGRACAGGHQPEPPKLRVEKTGDAECRVGRPCSFEITVANDTGTPFSAPMRIGDAIGIDGHGRLEGVPVEQVAPPFGCAAEPSALPLSCVAGLSLGPKESRTYKVVVTIPDGGALSGLEGRIGARNCVGFVPPGTPVVGGAGEGSGGAAGGAYACHPFVVVKEPVRQCSQGFVRNEAGRCVCPPGTGFRNGRCAPEKMAEPQPEPPRRCVLLRGQVRTSSGECVCPRRTELVNGACVPVETGEPPPPPVRQCKLLPGQIRTRGGDCVCPAGTALKGRRCVKVKTVEECTVRGQVHDKRGDCVCPRGTEAARGACRKPQAEACPAGTVRKGKRCVVVRRDCPEGMIGEYPDCFRKRDRVPAIGPAIGIDPGDLLDLLPRHRPRSGGERQHQDDGAVRPGKRKPPPPGED